MSIGEVVREVKSLVSSSTKLPPVQPGEVVYTKESQYLVTYVNGSHGYFDVRAIDKEGKPTIWGSQPNTTLFKQITREPIVSVIERDDKMWREVLEKVSFTSNYTESAPYAITVGTDPEVFAMNADGEVISAWEYLEQKALGVPVFFDGFQAEWITQPTSCLEYQCTNVRKGMRQVLEAARKYDPKARLIVDSVVDIPKRILLTAPPERLQLGCSPSENVYGEKPLRLKNPARLKYRTAGWHMHFGLGGVKLPQEKIDGAVRMLDQVVGVGLVAFGRKYNDPRRRELYGKAGEYRYGKTLEYRVPDVVMGAHPTTWHLFWDIGRKVLQLGLKGFEFVWDSSDEETRGIINGYDVDGADRVLRRNEKVLRRIVESCYGTVQTTVDAAIKALYEGIDAVVETPRDLEKNWRLGDSSGDGALGTFGARSNIRWASTSQDYIAKGKLIP